MADDDLQRLLKEIQAARAALPPEHRELLDQLGVQEAAIDDWPDGVIDLYATLREPTPTPQELQGAAATWLNELRTVAFNAPAVLHVSRDLDEPSRRTIVARIAWHEYGHALSVTRATHEHRKRGPELLALLPEGLQETIDYPGRYRTNQVFDEIVATIYSVIVGRVRDNGYFCPHYLHADIFDAFREVIPWPRTP
jgi:phage tail protein X